MSEPAADASTVGEPAGVLARAREEADALARVLTCLQQQATHLNRAKYTWYADLQLLPGYGFEIRCQQRNQVQAEIDARALFCCKYAGLVSALVRTS